MFVVVFFLKVRGAPLIATVGMYSLLLELHNNFQIDKINNFDNLLIINFINYLFNLCDYLLTARPTAINLANIIDDLKQFINVEQKNFDYNQIVTEKCIFQLIEKF